MSTNGKEPTLAQAVEATETAFNAATAELDALKTEEKELPAQIRRRAYQEDTAEVVRLKMRQVELSALVFATDVKVRQRKIAMVKAKAAVARAVQVEAEQLFAKRLPELEAEYRQTEAKLKDLQMERMQLDGDKDQKQKISRDLHQLASEQERQLADFIDSGAGVIKEAPKTTPVSSLVSWVQ